MKYIRTKDGRIFEHPHPNAEVFTFRYEIAKQAYTIEELCDFFVCESNEEGNDFKTEYKDIFSMKRDSFFTRYREHYNFYGVIYIKGKGTVYVAKMNDKGELCLL